MTIGSAEGSKDLTLCLLKGWCVQAGKFKKKKDHARMALRPADALPDEVLDSWETCPLCLPWLFLMIKCLMSLSHLPMVLPQILLARGNMIQAQAMLLTREPAQ